MPWFCGYCNTWYPARHEFCPRCGRSARGHLCKSCREPVPDQARFCPKCGGNRLIESAQKPGSEPVRWGMPAFLTGASWPVRIGVLLLVALLVWGGIVLITPLVVAAYYRLLRLVIQAAEFAVLFLIITGILPKPLGDQMRAIAGAILKLLWRLIGAIVGWGSKSRTG